MRRWTALAVATGLATFATPAAAALPQHQPPHHCATATQRCDGAIQVPLNWADPNSERISVNFVWVPRADRSRPSAGVVAGLGGGPAGTVRSTSLFVATLGPLLERHDLLVVERRGFGEAAPWRCPEIDLVRQETIRACADRVGPRAQFFTTDQRVADVEAVRGALGVPALMLYGLSYGTLDVQAYLARYPQRVTAAVMDSVVRADANGYVTGTLYSDHLKEGLEQLDVPCRESRSCGSLPGDGASRWAELARHLRREPDPQVPFFALDQLMARLDEPTAGREANAAAAAYLAGDKAPLRRLAPLIGPGRGADMNDMFRTNSAFLAYSCADSAFPYDRSASPEVRRQQLAEYRRTHPERPFTAAEVFGAAGFLEDWCVNWPTPRPSPPLPPDARYPDVPVFAIAGELDGDTAANTTALAREFPRGRSVVVPFGGHTGSVVGYWSYSECLAEQVRSFFVDPTRPGAKSSCSAKNYRALGRFPSTVGELPPVHAAALDDAERGSVAAAFATASDALSRRNPNSHFTTALKNESGLRGGTVTFDDPARRIRLDGVRFVADVAVSGEIQLPRDGGDGEATAELTVSADGAAGHRLRMSWPAFHSRPTVSLRGTFGDRPFVARTTTVP